MAVCDCCDFYEILYSTPGGGTDEYEITVSLPGSCTDFCDCFAEGTEVPVYNDSQVYQYSLMPYGIICASFGATATVLLICPGGPPSNGWFLRPLMDGCAPEEPSDLS